MTTLLPSVVVKELEKGPLSAVLPTEFVCTQ